MGKTDKIERKNKQVNISSLLRRTMDFSPQACHLEWREAAVFISEFPKVDNLIT
jgi:hypothetical protein